MHRFLLIENALQMPNRKKFAVKNCEVTVYANGTCLCALEFIIILSPKYTLRYAV